MRRVVLAISGLAGALAVAFAYVMEPTRTSYAWLAAWMAAWITGVGAQTVLCLAALSDGTWLVPIRRPFEALAASLPLSSVALMPALLLRFDTITCARAAMVMVLPILATEWFGHVSRAQDHERRERGRDLRRASAVGLVLLFASSTLAGFDWIGGLHPRWLSNGLGLELLSGGVVTALGIVALGVTRDLGVEHRLTLGRALFVGVCAWMYLSFAPFLVVWMADRSAAVSWYGPRITGAWWISASVIVIARFVVPFVALLTDPLRKQPSVLLAMSALVVLTEPLVLAWMVLPSWSPDRVSMRWSDLGALALVASSSALVSWARTRNVPAMPVGDPALAHVKAYRAR